MNKTKIEWCDYTINPVKGLCPVACDYCYARKMYKRFGWNMEIRFVPDELLKTRQSDSHSRIFWGSTMELFGDWIKDEWLQSIFDYIYTENYHTHIFLTKQPQNLAKWSPFPENCWVGASVTGTNSYEKALKGLSYVSASVRFLSIEPFLEYFSPLGRDFDIFHWLIIGSQTQPVRHPPRAWVEDIISVADRAKLPVFVKEPLASYYNIHRQEFPVPSLIALGK